MSSNHKTGGKTMTASPSNALIDAVRLTAMKHLNDHQRKTRPEIKTVTPDWALFVRWYRDGSKMWVETSSGSRVMTVRFGESGERKVKMADWAGGREEFHAWTMEEFDASGNRVR